MHVLLDTGPAGRPIQGLLQHTLVDVMPLAAPTFQYPDSSPWILTAPETLPGASVTLQAPHSDFICVSSNNVPLCLALPVAPRALLSGGWQRMGNGEVGHLLALKAQEHDSVYIYGTRTARS